MDTVIRFRINTGQKKQLEEKAKEYSLTVSALLRLAAQQIANGTIKIISMK